MLAVEIRDQSIRREPNAFGGLSISRDTDRQRKAGGQKQRRNE